MSFPAQSGMNSSGDPTTSQRSPSTAQPRSAKSWLTRSLTTLMQLPKSAPLATLRWTTPEGPMPRILHLPSRDEGRSIEVYIWVPPAGAQRADAAGSTSDAQQASSSTSPTPPPIEPSFSGTLRPCLVDFHGGGFIMGGPLEEAPWCAALARSGIIAVSVAYRLGPDWEFPAALHDAEDVVRAVLGEGNGEAAKCLRDSIDQEAGGPGRIGIDKDKVALSGFSSGGNVALNMLLDLPSAVLNSKDATSQDGDWPSPFQPSHTAPIPALLFFPSLDARQAPHERSRPASMAPAGGFAKFIGRNLRNAYLPADMVQHPRASPGLAPTSTIHASTRALLILPEMDTLAEQSETWVRKLDAAGLAEQSDDQSGGSIGETLQRESAIVRVHRLKGMGHGFTTYPDAMIDVETRKVKALVMEQARRWVIGMLGGNPGAQSESRARVKAIAEGEAPSQGVSQPAARLARAAE